MMLDGVFDRWDGIIAIIGLLMFFRPIRLEKEENKTVRNRKRKTKMPMTALLIFLLSGGAIYLSADWLIRAVLEIASELKIGTDVVAQTAVALGDFIARNYW